MWYPKCMAGLENFVNKKTAARLLGITFHTLNRRIEEGVIKPSDVGGNAVFSKADIERIKRDGTARRRAPGAGRPAVAA